MLAFVSPPFVIMQEGQRTSCSVCVTAPITLLRERLDEGEEERGGMVKRDFPLFKDRGTDRKTERNGASQSIS